MRGFRRGGRTKRTARMRSQKMDLLRKRARRNYKDGLKVILC